MSFAFIPSAVKRKKPVLVSSHALSASISVGAQVTSESVDNSSRETKDQASSESVKKKIKIDEHISRSVTETKPTTATSITGRDLEDLAQLVCLALSDYAVWADVDLRCKIDWGNNQGLYGDTELTHDKSTDDNGYIPLAYIMRHSQIFRLASSSSSSLINQPQTTFIKAIRTHASHLIDVRLIIPSSSSSTFPRNNTVHWTKPHIQTGYELRRKEVLSALSKHGKKEWDALTVYAENIPDQYRSIPGITRFFNELLPPSPSFTNASVPRIQNISLPSHHQDQPNSIPTCKSFALVTLSHDGDVDALLKAWSWEHPTDVVNSDQPMETGIKSAAVNTKGKGKDRSLSDEEISSSYVGATKFGLRILTKARWEELRAEYLLYRQELVDEINIFQDEGEVGVYNGGRKGYVGETHGQEEQEEPRKINQIQVQKKARIESRSTRSAAIATNNPVDTAGIHSNSTYPPGCLVFVRNVHPETNKTTLRSLFLHAKGPTGFEVGDDGLDYLDYTKGMDCCYVRFRTPLHAQQLVHCLSSTPIVQTSGLDASGSSLATHSSLVGKNDSAIIAEQVLGKREEVYWQKVPEKIRRQAVDKAFVSST